MLGGSDHSSAITPGGDDGDGRTRREGSGRQGSRLQGDRDRLARQAWNDDGMGLEIIHGYFVISLKSQDAETSLNLLDSDRPQGETR